MTAPQRAGTLMAAYDNQIVVFLERSTSAGTAFEKAFRSEPARGHVGSFVMIFSASSMTWRLVSLPMHHPGAMAFPAMFRLSHER